MQGFTLIELLIVVAIIGILSTIAIVNFRLAQDKALTAKCASNQKALYTALISYKIDYECYPLADGIAGDEPSPNKTVFGGAPAANGYWCGVPWSLLKLGYVKDKSIFFCPVLAKKYPERKDYFRYAYNAAVSSGGGTQTGGSGGKGPDGYEGSLWLLRCLWLDKEYISTFDKSKALAFFPHGLNIHGENALYNSGNVVFETAEQVKEHYPSYK